MEPVSIRTKNPGAMWPGTVSKRFGSTEWIPCGGGNKAAVFPTYEQGGAAQFYLWAHNYSGMTLEAAIYKWSGHNSSPEYARFLSQHIPSLSMSTVITKDFLASPEGLTFMKVQAHWEAGKPYPMTDVQWKAAQAMAFGEPVPVPTPMPVPTPVPAPSKEAVSWQIKLIRALFGLVVRLFK